MDSVANRLSEALHSTRTKQIDIAELCKVSRSTVSQWCKGAYEPRRDKIEIIARHIGVREAWLMGYDVPMEREDSPTDDFAEMFLKLDYLDKGIIIGQMMNMLSQDKYKKGSVNIG